jgi:hypothetical protein
VKIPEASEVSSLQEESENVKAERQTHREELKFLRIQPVSHDQTTLFRSHRTLTSHHRTTAALCRALAVWLRPIISTLIALAKERKKNTRESFQQRPVVTVPHILSYTHTHTLSHYHTITLSHHHTRIHLFTFAYQIRHCDVQTALWLTSNTVHNTDERPEIFLSHNTQNSFTDNELTDQPLPEN